MKMMTLIALLMASHQALAKGEASWQASGIGASLTYRGVAASSPVLRPPAGAAGPTTLVAWRYRLLAPAPAGLEVRLCSMERCVTLDGGSGTTRGFTGQEASQPLRFVWSVPGGGKLWPVLRVASNEVIVNYRRAAP